MDENRQIPDMAMPERRKSDRFPIMEEVHYRFLDRKGDGQDGSGMTLDMSRSGVLFTTADPLTTGRLIELSVNWPVRLDGICPLKLVATGHVVRTSGALAALKIERYQFKTRGRTLAPSDELKRD